MGVGGERKSQKAHLGPVLEGRLAGSQASSVSPGTVPPSAEPSSGRDASLGIVQGPESSHIAAMVTSGSAAAVGIVSAVRGLTGLEQLGLARSHGAMAGAGAQRRPKTELRQMWVRVRSWFCQP